MGIYTDLALEAREINPNIAGITEEEERRGEVTVSRIQVETMSAAVALGKPIGTYITIEAPQLTARDTQVFKEVGALLSEEIENLLKKILPENIFEGKSAGGSVLVVGLGNRGVTADALGPRVVERTFVTRHITEHLPDIIGVPMRSVAAIAPGVLGTTGVETLEMLRGITERVKPKVVIAIDALASRRANRISTAIQLTDTGINPGSGVGNDRLGITKDTLGVPVIAIGVPTVVYAATIIEDTLELVSNETPHETKGLSKVVESVINEHFGPMIVTPKEIDVIITDMSGILADGMNLALHRSYYDQIEELLA